MRANGKTIKWKEVAFLHGPMAGDMRETILTTRKKDKVSFFGKFI